MLFFAFSKYWCSCCEHMPRDKWVMKPIFNPFQFFLSDLFSKCTRVLKRGISVPTSTESRTHRNSSNLSWWFGWVWPNCIAKTSTSANPDHLVQTELSFSFSSSELNRSQRFFSLIRVRSSVGVRCELWFVLKQIVPVWLKLTENYWRCSVTIFHFIQNNWTKPKFSVLFNRFQ